MMQLLRSSFDFRNKPKLVIILLCILSFCPPQVKLTKMSQVEICKNYLHQYGYINDEVMKKESSMRDPEIQSGLEILQTVMGVRSTGILDNRTMSMISQPRCGNPDSGLIAAMKGKEVPSRRKRFMLNSKWEKRTLTYHVHNYPKCCLLPSVIEAQLAQAFGFWMEETHPYLIIKRSPFPKGTISYEVDIEISFVEGEHGDEMPFLSPGTRAPIAHAFYPSQEDDHVLRGDIHFNLNERWTSGVLEGQNFLQTATHEIGHALGLEHSMEKKAAMFFMVSEYDPNFNLHQDDIHGIQKLYKTGEDEIENDLETSASSFIPVVQTPRYPKLSNQNRPLNVNPFCQDEFRIIFRPHPTYFWILKYCWTWRPPYFVWTPSSRSGPHFRHNNF